jgi:hypothetical protein
MVPPRRKPLPGNREHNGAGTGNTRSRPYPGKARDRPSQCLVACPSTFLALVNRAARASAVLELTAGLGASSKSTFATFITVDDSFTARP